MKENVELVVSIVGNDQLCVEEIIERVDKVRRSSMTSIRARLVEGCKLGLLDRASSKRPSPGIAKQTNRINGSGWESNPPGAAQTTPQRL